MTILSSDLIHWDKEKKLATADASDFKGVFGNDFYTMLTVRSRRTDRLAQFTLRARERDADNDVRFWDFWCAALPGWRLRVFND